MTVGRMLSEMTSAELSEWMALYRIESEERDERQTAQRLNSQVEARLMRARGR
jgi:hypothetical protein